jgi:hypothetical protein
MPGRLRNTLGLFPGLCGIGRLAPRYIWIFSGNFGLMADIIGVCFGRSFAIVLCLVYALVV